MKKYKPYYEKYNKLKEITDQTMERVWKINNYFILLINIIP